MGSVAVLAEQRISVRSERGLLPLFRLTWYNLTAIQRQLLGALTAMSVDTNGAWHPTYTITSSIARRLMEIESARVVVEKTPLPAAVQAELARKAHVRATHYSTRIEGNRLTLEEAEQVISHTRRQFAGRERDVAEVQNYWNALIQVEQWATKTKPVTEDAIRRIHAIVMNGSRAKPLPYRDGQNVIRDSATGAIIYLPPEAADVPVLMHGLVDWVHRAQREQVPGVIIAALAHYQFVTIHPYYDGNGRTARLLATFILHASGYGLNGLFSLEEYHARDLEAYYGALDVGDHHNYYFGRAKADLTDWLEYFTTTLETVFRAAKDEALRCAEQGIPTEPKELHRLDHRARTVLGLFARQKTITSGDVSHALGLSQRMSRVLLSQWVADGWLLVADSSKRARSYSLAPEYQS
jgi:Fic family protein